MNKQLIRVTTHLIEGFEGDEWQFTSYRIYSKVPPNDHILTQSDVSVSGQTVGAYDTFESLGEINDAEIKTLKKFKIV